MSATSDDSRSRELSAVTDRLPAIVSGVGLACLTAGAVLIGGWRPIGVALGTAIVWWRTTTPLALTAVTIGLAAVIPPVIPAIQFGGSMAALATLGVPIVVIAGGMGLLTVGSWLASGTVPPLAGGWMLLPLGVGWLGVGGAVIADMSLWLVLAGCGGATLLSANAITQLTEHRLTTTDETATTDHIDQ